MRKRVRAPEHPYSDIIRTEATLSHSPRRAVEGENEKLLAIRFQSLEFHPMTSEIHTQNIDLVSKGWIGVKAQHLLTTWYRTDGLIDDPNVFAGIAPHFVRLAGHVPENDSPEILFVGCKSLLGREIRSSRRLKSDRRSLFRPDYRRATRDGFEQALHEPVLQEIQDVFFPDSGPSVLLYGKLTICWRTTAGTPYLISYSKLLGKRALDHPSNRERPHDYSTRPPGRMLSLPAEPPTQVPKGLFG